MLTITVPAKKSTELWDEKRQMFIYSKETKGQTLQLEHSLISVSKWEQKWCKSFLSHADKTYEETIDYIKCMTLTQNVNSIVYENLTSENIRQINEYIDAPMTATVIPKQHSVRRKETVTSELIYYWMIALSIPIEFQKWHLNRLLTLIELCNMKNQPPKRTSRRELTSRYASINAANRKRFNSKG